MKKKGRAEFEKSESKLCNKQNVNLGGFGLAFIDKDIRAMHFIMILNFQLSMLLRLYLLSSVIDNEIFDGKIYTFFSKEIQIVRIQTFYDHELVYKYSVKERIYHIIWFLKYTGDFIK